MYDDPHAPEIDERRDDLRESLKPFQELLKQLKKG